MKLLILGGGQLARMLASAGTPLGVETTCIDPNPTACAREVCKHIHANLDETNKFAAEIANADAITFETENIPLAFAKAVNALKPIQPTIEALRITQHRLLEKTFLNKRNIKTAPFCAVSSLNDLEKGIEELSTPAILKTCTLGYDGKGQALIKNKQDVIDAWNALKNQELILEGFVNFKNEVSLISVRNSKNEFAFYPLVKNHHQDGILRSSEAPYSDSALQQQAEDWARIIMKELNYVGVMAIEFFNTSEGLLVNEIAPRVHNSGHWTIEGAKTSQFENHLRAIFNLPLGSTEITQPSVMINCIGQMPNAASIGNQANVHYHDYHKEPRANRKVGHITILNEDSVVLNNTKEKIAALI